MIMRGEELRVECLRLAFPLLLCQILLLLTPAPHMAHTFSMRRLQTNKITSALAELPGSPSLARNKFRPMSRRSRLDREAGWRLGHAC